MLKYIVLAIVSLIGTVLIYAFFKAKSTLVETSIVIDKPVEQIDNTHSKIHFSYLLTMSYPTNIDTCFLKKG